jgi:hypothetical protein
MLAELFVLYRNLELQGLSAARVHRDFDAPSVKSRPTVVVHIDASGRLHGISALLPELEPAIWTLKNGNHTYFPAVRTDEQSLLPLSVDDPLRAKAKKADAGVVQLLCQQSRAASVSFDFQAIAKAQALRIQSWPVPEGDEEAEKLHEFAKGFLQFASNPNSSKEQVLNVIERVAGGTSDAELLRTLALVIIGTAKKEKGTEKHIGVQMLFDLWVEAQPAFSIYSYAMKDTVLNALLSGDDAREASSKLDTKGVCAISGRSLPLLRRPFPGWAAKPIISKPYRPFDKFTEAKCNARYGRGDSEGFDVGSSIANALVGALQKVTSPEQFGRTWRGLKNGATTEKGAEKSDLFIAFPSCTTDELVGPEAVAIVDVFCENKQGATDESRLHRKLFSDAARPVCEALERAVARESAADHIAPDISLLLVREVSAGQIQIAYSAQPKLTEFVAAVSNWEQSGSNLPTALRIPLDPNSTKGRAGSRPRLLHPESIVRVLARQWSSSGRASSPVPAPSIGMVLDMFLRRPGALPGNAEGLLRLTVQRNESLLAAVGGAMHRGQWKEFHQSVALRRGFVDPGYAAIHVVSLLGSLLHIMNSKSSEYSRSSAFLLGQLLAGMDELHKHYCTVVRDGGFPPALIGNSLLGRATDGPASALAELLDRARPYLGWAKTVATPNGGAPDPIRIAIYSARKLLRLVQPLADCLGSDMQLSQPMSDIQKAHLLLGYLSSVADPESQPKSESNLESESVDS